MTLGDIFERTFTLIGKTFVRNLIVAAIFLVIPVVLMTIAADNLYSSIADINIHLNGLPEQTGFNVILPYLGQVGLFVVSAFMITLGVLLAEITISYIVGKELMGEPVSLSEAVQETFYMKWLYGIGQGLIKYFAIIGGIVILVIFGAVLYSMIGSGFIIGLLVLLFVVVGIPAIFFLVLRWYFSLTAVAIEDLGPIDALRQSWSLVEGYWWRTCGILILFSILSQFVISIISIPIQFGTMFNFYKEFFTALGRSGGNIDPQTLHQTLKTMGPGIGIGTGISSLFSLLITPVFTVVMYFDLRARKNDLPGMEAPQPQPDAQNLPPEIIQ